VLLVALKCIVLQEIAREKAGIFKVGAPALTVPQPPDAMAALQVLVCNVAPLLRSQASGSSLTSGKCSHLWKCSHLSSKANVASRHHCCLPACPASSAAAPARPQPCPHVCCMMVHRTRRQYRMRRRQLRITPGLPALICAARFCTGDGGKGGH